MIKKLLTPLVFIALFLIAGVAVFAVLDHRNSYVQFQTASQRQAEAQKAESSQRQIEAQQADRANLVTRYNSLRAECAKGHEAYARLSVFNQRVVGEPQCGEELQ